MHCYQYGKEKNMLDFLSKANVRMSNWVLDNGP